MTRAEELILKQIDQTLSFAEQAELEALLEADEAARRLLARHLELEAALRGTGRIPDVADATVAHLYEARRTDLERSVMRTIGTLPVPSARPSSRRLLGLTLASAAAVLLAVAAWISWRPVVPPAGAEPWAMLVECSPDVLLDGPVEPRPASAPAALSGVQGIRTQADDGYAVVRYADGSRVELFGNSLVRLEPASGTSKRVRLVEGSLRLNIRPQPVGQPVVVETPHAELRARDTRFGVTALAGEGTRVHLEAGQAELLRDQATPTTLEPGATVFVSAEADPVVQQGRPRILTEPSREIAFPGLSGICFTPDGLTVLGFTSSQRVSWQPAADRLEASPLGGEVRKSYDIPMSGLPVLAMLQSSSQRLELWDMVQRQPRYTGPNPEPRLSLAAVSPQGDWWAYWTSARTGLRVCRPAPAESVDITYRGKLSCIGISADGRFLAVGRAEGKEYVADVLDPLTGQLVARLPVDLPTRRKAPVSLSFAADGSRLAVAQVGCIQVWDVATQKRLAVIHRPVATILRLALSPDGQAVAAAAQDDWVWLWQVGQPTEPHGIRIGQSARGLAFAPDGRSLAVLDKSNRITLWNLPE